MTLKNIKLDLQAVENMLFFWNMIGEREKVSEIYILTVAELEQYRGIYDTEFDNISVRKVMSALSNREVFRGDNRKESRFWVDNLWMLEDVKYTMDIVGPIKRLHLDDLVQKINKSVKNESVYETLNVVVVPFYNQPSLVRNNTLYINFFKALPERGESQELLLDKLPIKEYILQQLTELVELANRSGKGSRVVTPLRNVFY
jgi:hypothetical protein